MRWPGRLGGHRRWREALDAYVDGALGGAARAGFERHLESCAACRSRLSDVRAVKAILGRNLPPVEAPRSFAIRPAMLAATAPAPARPARSLVAMRFAQGVAGFAVLAFASLVVSGLVGGGSGSTTQRSAPAGAAHDEAAPAAAQATRGHTAEQSLRPASPTVPDYVPPGVQGASAGTPEPQPTPAPKAVPDSGREDVFGAPAGATPAEPSATSPGGGTDWRLVAEAALAVVAVFAAGGYLVARRAQRRSFHA